MDASRHLSETIRAFHLDHPDATWHQLREHLIWVAEGLLSSAHDVYSLRMWGDLYEDVAMNLTEIAATMPLSVDQHEHVTNAKRVMVAAQDRLRGDSVPLVTIIKDLEGEKKQQAQAVEDSSGPQSVRGPALTFEELSRLYLADRAGEQKATTLSSTKFIHGVLTEMLGTLDLRVHTRGDLVALRDRLAATRKPSTVNQILAKLSAVFSWGELNGHLEKRYDKKLKLTKGIESDRKAFSQEQVSQLMAYASSLPEASWKRWLLSLGVVSGGRLNEICQLTTDDIITLQSGGTALSINERGEGKSVKTKGSTRLIPLTDGAYGFDLAAFLRYVDSCKAEDRTKLAQLGYRPAGEWVNQHAIPTALSGSYSRGLVYHSLRHSLSSLMQAHGVPTTHAQAVMGHVTGTITFDTYGSGVPVEVLAEMLKGVFSKAV